MNSWQRIAATEILEQRRQPAMLFILVLNYALWLVVFGVFFSHVDSLLADPEARAMLQEQLSANGVELDAMLRVAVSTFGSLIFTNLPLYVAIFSGNSVLHDRSLGTLPFLMLAPVTRWALLFGKLAGAMAIPTLIHVVFVGVGCLSLGRLEMLAAFPVFSGTLAWWVALLFGAPASAALVGAIGTAISALSHDVRTAMQTTSFVVGLLSLGIGYALVDALGEGPEIEVAFAAGCLVLSGLALRVGARIISRDVA
jgi:ABC-type transport system involved in multi-copper enzyme maturation permease subunit